MLELLQPVAVMVSVKVYVWVEDGLTLGFEFVEEKVPTFEDQLYVLPDTVELPIFILTPLQIVDGVATVAFGKAFHVMNKLGSSVVKPDWLLIVLNLILYFVLAFI